MELRTEDQAVPSDRLIGIAATDRTVPLQQFRELLIRCRLLAMATAALGPRARAPSATSPAPSEHQEQKGCNYCNPDPVLHRKPCSNVLAVELAQDVPGLVEF